MASSEVNDLPSEHDSPEDNSLETRDGRILLQKLPEDVWRMILEDYVAPEEKEKMTHVSLFFGKVLLNQKPLFLFPKVWPFIRPQFEKAYYEKETAYRVDKCLSCRRTVYRQWFSPILKMRAVSKTWAEILDSYYEYAEFEIDSRRPEIWTPPLLKAQEAEATEAFMEHFQKTHKHLAVSGSSRSPLAFHKFTGNVENSSDLDEWKSLWRVLKGYGRFIKIFSLTMNHYYGIPIIRPPRPGDAFLFHRQICKSLGMIPNLEHLMLVYIPPFFLGAFTPEESVQFTEFITQNPLPTLETLKGLTVGYEMPHPLLFALLQKYKSSLNLLAIHIPNAAALMNAGLLQTLNLTELVLYFERERDFAWFQAMPPLWNIKKLTLEFLLCDSTSWPLIFQAIRNKWNDSLTHLHVKLPLASSEEQVEEWARTPLVHLDNLTNLRLGLKTGCALDLILPLKINLEYLHVVLNNFQYSFDQSRKNDNNRNDTVINCVGYMKRSNIWTLFPKLKTIDFDEMIEFRKREEKFVREDLI